MESKKVPYKFAVAESRAIGKGCPVCSNRIVVFSNSLATTHPNLATEWHPTKNGKLTVYDVTAGSHKKIWWKCKIKNEHVWKTAVYCRKGGTGCPYCFKR